MARHQIPTEVSVTGINPKLYYTDGMSIKTKRVKDFGQKVRSQPFTKEIPKSTRIVKVKRKFYVYEPVQRFEEYECCDQTFRSNANHTKEPTKTLEQQTVSSNTNS